MGCIAVCLLSVTNGLQAASLISIDTYRKMVAVGQLNDSQKASELMSVLYSQMKSSSTGRIDYLVKTCRVFKKQDNEILSGISGRIISLAGINT